MCFLYSIFSKKNKEKGFSLIEILTVIGLAGFTSLLTGAFLAQILGGFNFARFSMDEQKLYADLAKTIGDPASCKGNLKPKASNLPATTATNREGLYGINYQKGIGELEELYVFNSPTQKTGTPVIKIGDFGTNLKIIKMSLEDTDNSHHKPTSANNQDPTKLEDRVFKVYYNHRRGRQKKSDSTCKSAIFTIDSNGNKTISTQAVTTDCYSMECDLRPYETDNQATPNVDKCEADCQLITRPSGGGGSGTVDCYNVDSTGKNFVGCGTTEQNTDTTTTAFGFNAGKVPPTGTDKGISNTFIGNNTGSSITTGDYNTFIGADTGNKNTTGGSNTFIGTYAGKKTTTGLENVFIGYQAGLNNTDHGNFSGENDYKKTASRNTYIGMNAGRNNTSSRNSVFIGYQSGLSSNGGQGNTFIGSDSGKKNTGEDNVFIGVQSGQKNVEARSNTFVGAYTGTENISGSDNVFIGKDAGLHNTTANNTFIGTYSGKANTTGGGNTFIGRSAGVTNTTGDDNVFIGKEAGEDNTTGDDNIFIGKEAGEDNISGDDNIFIGKGVGEHNKGGIDKTNSRQLNIGNLIFGRMPSLAPATSTANFFPPTGVGTNKYLKDGTNQEEGLVIYGNLYVHGKAFANCGNDGTCGPWSTSLGTPGGSSSKVYKKNITPFLDFNKALTDITTTPLFTYEYKEDHPNHQRMGIIAEDLPQHLQIKDQYEPVKPDWVSIYGTFWASIKALFNKVTNLTKSILRLNSITSSLKVNLYEVKEKVEDLHGVKDRLEVLEKETQFLRNQNKELKKKIKALSKKGVSQ